MSGEAAGGSSRIYDKCISALVDLACLDNNSCMQHVRSCYHV